MVNLDLLKTTIGDSGITMVALARKTGIKRPTLINRLDGVGEFSASEIMGMCEALHINKQERERIFFAKEVE